MTATPPARQQLLANVAGIRDVVAAQWRAEEVGATLSAASVAALEGAGIFAMKLPDELGGFEADPVTQLLVLAALAEVNPSAAWCAMVGATGSGLPGAFLADAAVATMYAGGKRPRGAIVAAPLGRADAVEGGFRLRGRWPFASGVRHAEWLTLGAIAALHEGAAPVHTMFCFPATSATIHDNWQVMGLRGTGSCDVSVDDLFVPAGFAWDFRDAVPRRGGAIFRIGHPGFVVNEHAGFALGLARRALDAFVSGVATRSRGASGTLSARAPVQRMVGEAEMRLAAARALAIDANERAYALVLAGEKLAEHTQAELRAVAVHCTDVAVDIASRAFRFAGGGAVYEGNVLQQCLRDANVAAQHLIVSEIAYENLGQFLLGAEGASAVR